MVQIGGAWDDSEAELSAEDLATLDGIWKTSSGEVVDSEAVTTLAVPVRPEVPAGADVQEEPAAGAASELEAAKDAAFKLGVSRGIDPFMTLSFMALPVIPTLRITTRGVVDVVTQQYV